LKETKTFIGGNSVNPRKQAGILPEIVNVSVNFDEYFLGQVIRVIMIDDHFSHMPVYALLVLTNEQIEPIVAGIGIPYFV
jgi:hypothetical protein